MTLESRANLSSKIRSLSNSLPLQMGVVRVSNVVDPKVMIALMAQYGNPKYLQAFEEKSMPISLTSLDTIMLDAFQQQQSGKTNERRGETAEEKKVRIAEKDNRHVSQMSYKNDKMFNIIQTMLQNEEIKMTEENSFINHIASGEETKDQEDVALQGKDFYALAEPRRRIQNVRFRFCMSFPYKIFPWWNTEHQTS